MSSADNISYWVEKVDSKTGKPYWGNLSTKETTWQEPQTVSEWKQTSKSGTYYEVFDEKSKRRYYVCQKTRVSTWIEPLGKIVASQQRLDQSEHEIETKEESNTPSSEEAKEKQCNSKAIIDPKSDNDSEHDEEVWVECHDKNRNRNYYFSSKSKQTVWTVPEHAKVIQMEEWKQMRRKGSISTNGNKESKTATTNQNTSIERDQKLADNNESLKTATTNPNCSVERDQKLDTGSAIMNDDGSVHGWIHKRSLEEDSYGSMFAKLHGNELSLSRSANDEESSLITFEMDAFSTAVLSEDPKGADFLFIIELNSARTTWFLGVNSIEDMQLWLEALQIQTRKFRVASVDTIEANAVPEDTLATGRMRHFSTSSSTKSDPMVTRRARRTMRRFDRTNTSTSSKQRSNSTLSFGEPDEELDEVGEQHIPATFEEWAQENGFGELVPEFASAGYDDLQLIAELNEVDLKEMLAEHLHVDKPGRRMKIVLAVRKLQGLLFPK